MNVKLKRESRLLIMAITSVALFVHIVVICAASTREVVANKEFVWYNGKRPITLFLAWICFSSSDGSTGYV